MSATQRLKAQTNATQATTNVLNFDLRTQLRDGLKDTGKFTDVTHKYDSRRGHLNLTIRGGHGARAVDYVVKAAATKNLLIALSIVSQSYYDTTYRVTTLTEIKPTAVSTVKGTALATAVKATQTATPAVPEAKVKVYFGYDLVGSVSASIAKSIRQMIEAENKPKFADVVVVDLKTSAKVTLTVPYDVAQAVKAQVPSFNQAEWSIKSTHGISILKKNADTNIEQTWVIA